MNMEALDDWLAQSTYNKMFSERELDCMVDLLATGLAQYTVSNYGPKYEPMHKYRILREALLSEGVRPTGWYALTQFARKAVQHHIDDMIVKHTSDKLRDEGMYADYLGDAKLDLSAGQGWNGPSNAIAAAPNQGVGAVGVDWAAIQQMLQPTITKFK